MWILWYIWRRNEKLFNIIDKIDILQLKERKATLWRSTHVLELNNGLQIENEGEEVQSLLPRTGRLRFTDG